jgi:enediyne biosynthesis protein E4
MMRFVLALFLLSSSALADPAVMFTSDEKASGIAHRFTGEWQYMVGGGTAVFDCNGDYKPDMFLAGGEVASAFYVNTSTRGGALTFSKHVSGAEVLATTGAYPLDIDADGIKDLVILRVGENVVMKGEGNCTFTRANEQWGFDGGDGWSTAFAATFEKGSEFPTLAIGNYVNRYEEAMPWGSCTDNWLHRPDGKKFAPPIALMPSYCPLSILFTDWNRSGVPALRMSNDREYYEGGQEQMWAIEPGKAPRLYTQDEGWKYLRIWGMGVSSYDFDFDGYPEYYLSSMSDSKYQTLEKPDGAKSKPSYADIAWKKGVTAHRPYMGNDLKTSTGWHTQIEDVNNDGLSDIFVAKGNVSEMPDFSMKDPNNMFLQKADGTFLEAGGTSGVGSMRTSRGAALADFNLDGLVDMIVVNRNENIDLFRNTSTQAGHFLMLELQQEGANRDGIGSWIEVKLKDKTLRREALSGGGHASGQLGFWHFGLGGEAEAEVRVIWANGEAGPWAKVKADQFFTLERGKAPEAISILP